MYSMCNDNQDPTSPVYNYRLLDDRYEFGVRFVNEVICTGYNFYFI